VSLDPIRINDRKPFHTHPFQVFGNHATHASDPDNTKMKAGEVSLALVPPGVDRAPRNSASLAGRALFERNAKVSANDTDLYTPIAIETMSVPSPKSSAPALVRAECQSNERQAGCAGGR